MKPQREEKGTICYSSIQTINRRKGHIYFLKSLQWQTLTFIVRLTFVPKLSLRRGVVRSLPSPLCIGFGSSTPILTGHLLSYTHICIMFLEWSRSITTICYTVKNKSLDTNDLRTIVGQLRKSNDIMWFFLGNAKNS